jgi:hypothetical protein
MIDKQIVKDKLENVLNNYGLLIKYYKFKSITTDQYGDKESIEFEEPITLKVLPNFTFNGENQTVIGVNDKKITISVLILMSQLEQNNIVPDYSNVCNDKIEYKNKQYTITKVELKGHWYDSRFENDALGAKFTCEGLLD